MMAKLIMVVNDTQEILDMFRDILTGEGYAVSLHAYGKREVEEVQQVGPDLIISDFPPLDREQYGWQFLQLLKMTRATAQIPVVVCTTNLRAIQDNQSWMASKGIRVVPKPFDVDELLMAIESLVGKADEPGPGPVATATEELGGPHRGPTAQDEEAS
jgi:CheY-like chemotaxis protein